MKQPIKVAVLGGGGRTGKYLVSQLLSQGYELNILLRNNQSFPTNPLVRLIEGDAVDYIAVENLLHGCKAIISLIGQRPGEPMAASQATQNILKAMAKFGIRRYILLGGVNIDTPADKKSPEIIASTNWMKTNFPEIQKDRQKAYSLLVNSDTDWTLVRVPFIEFVDFNSKITVNPHNCLGNKISASNISTFLIKQLFDETYYEKSPFIANL